MPRSMSADPNRSWRRLPAYALLTAGAVATVLPFVWMVLGSFKTDAEIFRFPPTWLPEQWRFENYTEAMRRAPFARYFLNSAIVAAAGVMANLLLSSMAGYAFARLDFPGKRVLFGAILATIMIPFYVTLIPLFVLVTRIPIFAGPQVRAGPVDGAVRRPFPHAPDPRSAGVDRAPAPGRGVGDPLRHAAFDAAHPASGRHHVARYLLSAGDARSQLRSAPSDDLTIRTRRPPLEEARLPVRTTRDPLTREPMRLLIKTCRFGESASSSPPAPRGRLWMPSATSPTSPAGGSDR